MAATDNQFNQCNRFNQCNNSADLEAATRQVERGSVRLLTELIPRTTTTDQRRDILKAIQETNAEHRKTNPALPEIEFTEESDWPSSWGRNLMLRCKKPGQNQEKELYRELDWTDNNNKAHWLINNPYMR